MCPTPIGNLEDVTLRVLRGSGRGRRGRLRGHAPHARAAGAARHRAARLVSFHEHNERARVRELVARMRAGETVALVCDAGMPLISDPGFVLVRDVHRGGHRRWRCCRGRAAVPVALVASGLPAARWCFVGFLPRKRGQRERVLADARETLVAFESPRRLAATLDMLARRDPERPVAVCRELTKLHEEVAPRERRRAGGPLPRAAPAGRGGAGGGPRGQGAARFRGSRGCAGGAARAGGDGRASSARRRRWRQDSRERAPMSSIAG